MEAEKTTDALWTEPYVPDDEIGRRTGSKVVRCTDCGLTTMPGTENEIVHKPHCTTRDA